MKDFSNKSDIKTNKHQFYKQVNVEKTTVVKNQTTTPFKSIEAYNTYVD